MEECRRLSAPFLEKEASNLRAGDEILLSGVIYTARDAAHKRMSDALARGEKLKVDLAGAVIFYAGPSPARPGEPMGSIGPTTSYRMDPYTPMLLELGVKGMIGKGERAEDVVASMKKNGAVYLGATGGIAALLARTIVSSRVLDYEDLGPEALRELEIRDMPLVVLIDSLGSSMYREGPAKFGKSGK
ncbi:fumarate hydratase subunit beta [Aminivibrio pyruvatiphilus]|uniref:Fumarate hydratase subunit beta n=1 Tax=Aminivibrio pyruvatiphilus TaxID=1005740 RepID=A0A4R8LWX1_9BACT|nr:Fe-S-containing hydro-lyase [Aminivibrio pyruvatiphilus]TDY52522.1 fumarate hydratase subunit beta [Aminivibrio pyruvatiphilus]